MKAVSLHLFLWPTGSEWHCTFCEKQSYHIFSYEKQKVSDIAHFVKASLITSLVMANRQWVTLHILWKAVISHLFLWPTGSEWHWTFCEMQSHHIFSYKQQHVSDIARFVKHSLITCFAMINSKWVTLHILWKQLVSHLFLWPTVCEWHCTFCERESHHIFSCDPQHVSDIGHFVKGSLITYFSMTNRMCVTLDMLWKAASSHLLLWPTASQWHCTFYKRHSYHIFSYDGQEVSDIALWKAVSSHLLLWPQYVSDIANFVKGSLITYFPMTNRQWVTLHIFLKAVSSYLFQ